MKKIFNPILVLLLFGSLSYAAWWHFEFDHILTGKIVNSEGVIFETRNKVIAKGRGTLEIIEYAFEYNGKYYFGQKQIGNSHKWQFLGNTVNIEFEKNNPQKSNITKFNNNFRKNVEHTLYSNTDLGYCQMKKTNNIIDYKEFGKKGIILHELIGISSKIGDTLVIRPIRNNQDNPRFESKKYLFLIGENEKMKLKDIENGWVLKE